MLGKSKHESLAEIRKTTPYFEIHMFLLAFKEQDVKVYLGKYYSHSMILTKCKQMK